MLFVVVPVVVLLAIAAVYDRKARRRGQVLRGGTEMLSNATDNRRAVKSWARGARGNGGQGLGEITRRGSGSGSR